MVRFNGFVAVSWCSVDVSIAQAKYLVPGTWYRYKVLATKDKIVRRERYRDKEISKVPNVPGFSVNY